MTNECCACKGTGFDFYDEKSGTLCGHCGGTGEIKEEDRK